MIKAAVLGFGVVGSGTYEVINTNREKIAKYLGEELEVKYIIDIRSFDGEDFASKVTADFDMVLADSEVSVIAEVIGGATIAYKYTKAALMAGKHVVTSNKELVATHGAELLAIAKEHNVNYMFEASVGGGIPVIRPIIQCLAANEIVEITGIVNGTTNYILTRMFGDNIEFSECLKEAQAKGYAEKDPTADVEGHDALRKICILTNLATGIETDVNAVTSEGITQITLEDVTYASKMNKVIKLLARSVTGENGKATVFVAPHMIDKDHPLASVNDVFNAVMVRGNMVDDVMFYGKGAGKEATASAVVADILDCIKHSKEAKSLTWEKGDNLNDVANFKSKYYVRFEGKKPAALNLGDEVSVFENEFAIITDYLTSDELDKLILSAALVAKAKIKIFN